MDWLYYTAAAVTGVKKEWNEDVSGEMQIPVAFFPQGIFFDHGIVAEIIRLHVLILGGPVTDDLSVQQHDGPENSGVVVRPVPVLLGQDQVPALVADEIFVEGGQKDDAAPAVPAEPTAFVATERKVFPALPDQFCPERLHACSAITDIQSAPPGEIFRRGGTVAAKIFSRQPGERLFAGKRRRLRQLLCGQGVAVFRREKIPAAKQPGILCQMEMVGEPVTVHDEPPVLQRSIEIFFPGDADG